MLAAMQCPAAAAAAAAVGGHKGHVAVASADKLQLHLQWDDPYGGTGLDEVNTAAAAAAVGLALCAETAVKTADAVPRSALYTTWRSTQPEHTPLA
jgi:hypothetical protein